MQDIIEKPRAQQREDEISLRELILLIKDWVSYILGYWKWLLLAGMIGGAVGVLVAINTPVQYEAKVTFVLEEDKSAGGLGAAMGLASQFGIDLGGAGGSGVFSGDNILELLKSRNIVEKALLSVAKTPGGKETTLAEWYLQSQGWKEEWQEHSRLKGVAFPAGLARAKHTVLQDSALFLLYEQIVKKQLFVAKPDKKLSIIQLVYKDRDEHLAKVMAESLLKEASDLYIETKTSKSRKNIQAMQAKADSIEALLNRKTYSLAAVQDMNVNPARRQASVGIELVGRDKAILQTLYGEVLKNLEMSKMMLVRETPLFQVIDEPILPLNKDRLGKLKAVFIGALLSTILLVGALFFKRIAMLIKSEV